MKRPKTQLELGQQVVITKGKLKGRPGTVVRIKEAWWAASPLVLVEMDHVYSVMANGKGYWTTEAALV